MTARVSMSWPQYLRGECRVDGTIRFMRPSDTEVLAALLLAGPVGLTPPELIEAVWPDPDQQPDDADGALSQSLMRLRAAGVPVLNRAIWGTGWLIPAEARAGPMRHGCRAVDACRKIDRTDRTKQPNHLCLRCRNLLKNEARTLRVTKLQARLWRFMERNPGVTIARIMQELGLHRRTVEGTLERLIRKGLAERVVRPGRQRGTTFARRNGRRYFGQLAALEDRTSLPPVIPHIDPRSRPVLEVICADPGLTTDELAARLGVTRCTANTRATRLAARGVVEQLRPPARHAFSRYLPTPAGIRALEHTRTRERLAE